MLLLAALLALLPASGLALCVADSGHLALELVGTSCEPESDSSCMTACDDCTDTPLTVAAHPASSHAVTAPALVPGAPLLAVTFATPVVATALPNNLASRTPLLRC